MAGCHEYGMCTEPVSSRMGFGAWHATCSQHPCALMLLRPTLQLVATSHNIGHCWFNATTTSRHLLSGWHVQEVPHDAPEGGAIGVALREVEGARACAVQL